MNAGPEIKSRNPAAANSKATVSVNLKGGLGLSVSLSPETHQEQLQGRGTPTDYLRLSVLSWWMPELSNVVKSNKKMSRKRYHNTRNEHARRAQKSPPWVTGGPGLEMMNIVSAAYMPRSARTLARFAFITWVA
jgi:hypothetical protein